MACKMDQEILHARIFGSRVISRELCGQIWIENCQKRICDRPDVDVEVRAQIVLVTNARRKDLDVVSLPRDSLRCSAAPDSLPFFDLP